MSNSAKKSWKFNKQTKWVEAGADDICSLDFSAFDQSDFERGHLIAAAPELLGALKLLIKVERLQCKNSKCECIQCHLVNCAKYAIAKAEGRICPSCDKETKHPEICTECAAEMPGHKLFLERE